MKRVITICLLLSVLVVFTNTDVLHLKNSAAKGIESGSSLLVPDQLFQYIDQQAFLEMNHSERVPSKESMSTYVFANEDGSFTTYFLDENVKFMGEDGKIHEKDISLVSFGEGYHIADNEYDVFLPTSIGDGVQMSYRDYSIEIKPSAHDSSSSGRKIGNTIVYDNCFGEGIHLRYTPALEGIKEDIILEHPCDASFTFILETNGLYLCSSEEGYYLSKSNDNGNYNCGILFLGDVIIYDNKGNPGEGVAWSETLEEGRTYILHIQPSIEFLYDIETEYPVTVDPTVRVSAKVSGSGLIEDCPIYEGKPNKNFSGYFYLNTGYTNSTYLVGRTVFKLPGLVNSSEFSYASVNEISSVKFYCRDSSGHGSQYVGLYPMTAVWTETNATWNGLHSSYISTTDFGTSMNSSSTWTEFNITDLAKGWKAPVYNSSCGFMLVNSNETSQSKKKSPYSSEYTDGTYRPYVVMTYTSTDLSLPDPNAQNKDHWCWIASAKMVGTHNGGNGLSIGSTVLSSTDGLHGFGTSYYYGERVSGVYTADSGQRQLSMLVKGDDCDSMGTDADIMTALQWASLNNVTTESVPYLAEDSDPFFSALNNELDLGRYVVGSFYNFTNPLQGHMVVITTRTGATYGFFDPWDNSNHSFTRLVMDEDNGIELACFSNHKAKISKFISCY